MTDPAPLVWTVEQAGQFLGVSRAHAYEMVARGEIPHLRLGRRIVVPKSALAALLASVDPTDLDPARVNRPGTDGQTS